MRATSPPFTRGPSTSPLISSTWNRIGSKAELVLDKDPWSEVSSQCFKGMLRGNFPSNWFLALFPSNWFLPIFPSFQAKLVLWNPHVYDLGSTLRPYSNRISSTSRRTSSWSSCIWSSQRYGNLSLLRLHRQISARLPSVFVCEKVFTDFVQYCICFYLNTYYKVSTDIIIYKVFLKSVVFNKIIGSLFCVSYACFNIGTYLHSVVRQMN